MRWMVVGLALVWLLGMPLKAVAEDVPPLALHARFAQPTPVQVVESINPPLVDQLARTYTTPKAIAGLLRTQFTFARDEVLFGEADHWQIPEEFAARKTGDCEDYALLAQALLRRNGIDAFIFSLFGEDGYAHTVGVFVDEQGHYNVIDASRIRYVRAKSLDALASWLHPAWSFGGIVEQEGHRGRMITRITNPHPVSFLASVDPLSGPPVSF